MGAGRAEKVDAGYPVSRHALSTCYVPDTTVSARDSALSPSPILTGALGGSAVKNPPSMQETWVQSLGRENPLEEDMAATPDFLPGESHGQRSLALQVHVVAESDTT